MTGSSFPSPLRLALAALVVLTTVSCEVAEGRGEDRKTAEHAGTEHVRPPVHVDSIRPIEEEVRRFRATLDREPIALSGGTDSLAGLVAALADAVNAADPDALARLAVDRSEFAFFYYPHTPYTRPPYELSPALVWFQLTNRSQRGMARLLAMFETRPLVTGEARCDGEPEPAGAGAVHTDCRVPVLDADGGWVEVALFGRVLERDGRFKILTYANGL